MKRRKAIQQIGLGLSAGIFAPHLLSSCKKEIISRPQYNETIVVIGAGVAGLYAADILISQGFNVIILEASNRNGGRVRSVSQRDLSVDNSSASYLYDYKTPPSSDFPLELGSDLVYGTDSAFGKILSTQSISVVDLTPATDTFFLGGQVNTASGWQGDPDFNAVQNFISTLSTSTNNVSIQAAANVSARAQTLLNSQTSTLGSTSDLLSASGVAGELQLQKHNAKKLTVKSNTLQDILLSRFYTATSRVTPNTQVVSIDYSGTSIVITDKNGKQYKAGKVIVTVPLTVLKSGDIAFTPSLPSTNVNAAAMFGMDSCFRMIINFKNNFWGNDSGFLWGGSYGTQYMNGGFNRSTFNHTLVVTTFGQRAQELSSQPATALNLILNELDSLYPDPTGKFPGLATKWVIRKIVTTNGVPNETDPVVISYDWSKEPYIRGGISYPLVGSTHQDRIDLSANVNGKVFFAGEATDVKGDAGTISGALNSAERVVAELIKSITA